MSDLAERLRAADGTVAVLGLGYVGLPAACLIARAGFTVHGIDLKAERVESVAAGRYPFEGEEPGLPELMAEVVRSGRLLPGTSHDPVAGCDVVVLCVETPVDSDRQPRLDVLRRAVEQVGSRLRRGALVIIESTIAPGTMERLVLPALEQASGMRAGLDFLAGHCPERVMPGRLLRNMTTMSRVLGGTTPEAVDAMAALYGHFVAADLDRSDHVTAEIVKTAENAYRDVNIAFANELALVCERSGADVWAVRELVNKSPGRNVLLPGAGVGGHCIPKDPWLLAAALGDGATDSLLAQARRRNDGMPGHVARLAVDALAEAGLAPAQAVVAVLGYSYLEDSDDTRNSPSAGLVAELEGLGARCLIHDPYVAEYAQPLEDVLAGADAAVVMVRHSAYLNLDPEAMRRSLRRPVLVDGRRVFDPAALSRSGMVWRSVGVGAPPEPR